ncbi:MAG: histidine triad nucleotide-binding protein [Chlamydiae bacterium]|nr:histidine triad nucleotide-binding protein [Chlamydiota bacterium]MBI3266827.1 histidine triad nucleotide-binding protein [Chlamydiota bacterium]
MNDCLFCKINRKQIPSSIAYEDEKLFAFHDINPQAPVHILIVPKIHIAKIYDTNQSHSSLLAHMIFIANKLAQEKEIDQGGYRLVLNCNADGGQSVDHIHLHLLGGRVMKWPPG